MQTIIFNQIGDLIDKILTIFKGKEEIVIKEKERDIKKYNRN